MAWGAAGEFTLENIDIVELQTFQTMLDGIENVLKMLLAMLLEKGKTGEPFCLNRAGYK